MRDTHKTTYLELRPWEEVARLYNERNGTNISVDSVRDSHYTAMQKLRALANTSRWHDLLVEAMDRGLKGY
jgi:hypothetical protein